MKLPPLGRGRWFRRELARGAASVKGVVFVAVHRVVASGGCRPRPLGQVVVVFRGHEHAGEVLKVEVVHGECGHAVGAIDDDPDIPLFNKGQLDPLVWEGRGGSLKGQERREICRMWLGGFGLLACHRVISLDFPFISCKMFCEGSSDTESPYGAFANVSPKPPVMDRLRGNWGKSWTCGESL